MNQLTPLCNAYAWMLQSDHTSGTKPPINTMDESA